MSELISVGGGAVAGVVLFENKFGMSCGTVFGFGVAVVGAGCDGTCCSGTDVEKFAFDGASIGCVLVGDTGVGKQGKQSG